MRPAAEDPRTAAALSAYRSGAVRWLGGGVIGVVLGVLLGMAAVAMAADGWRLPGVGLLVITLVLVGGLAAATGAGALLRGVRWQRALRARPWQVGRLRVAGPAILVFEPEGYDETLDEDDAPVRPVRLWLMSTAIWRTRAVQRLDGAQVRAAPVRGAEWVLTADGLDTVVGARHVHRSR